VRRKVGNGKEYGVGYGKVRKGRERSPSSEHLSFFLSVAPASPYCSCVCVSSSSASTEAKVEWEEGQRDM